MVADKHRSPFAPMEAQSVEALPRGEEWQYEPKWDGFRCLAIRNRAGLELWSKSGQPLARYFPELVEVLAARLPPRFALDGEIAIPHGKAFSFDALLQRIHPAASRIRRLSAETPAIYIIFDLLEDENGSSLMTMPLERRRKRLEIFAAKYFEQEPKLQLSPATTRFADAQKWLRETGAATDGVIAKRRDLDYRAGARDGMQKVKNFRSADCVVGGFRYAAKNQVVGSLLLGLYDDKSLLNHVGFTSAIPASDRPALTKKLERLIAPPGFTGNAPGGPSRWNQGKENSWKPLQPKLVVEVSFDHVTGERFRHGTKILRWRPDKAPAQCTMEQLRQKRASPLKLLKM
jgi:ATP-dependent DNA ligase